MNTKQFPPKISEKFPKNFIERGAISVSMEIRQFGFMRGWVAVIAFPQGKEELYRLTTENVMVLRSLCETAGIPFTTEGK